MITHSAPSVSELVCEEPLNTKKNNTTVIAHISDLHFTSRTKHNDRNWEALRLDLKGTSPDLIFVTGDLIDNGPVDTWTDSLGASLNNVRKYLSDTLCGDLGINPNTSLMVVPGNHDCRTKGIIRRNRSDYKEFLDTFAPQLKSRYYNNLGIYVFCFNSNTTDLGINLATGLISDQDLLGFVDLARQYQKLDPKSWRSATKIALLHHHPMPIAQTEDREGVTDREEFLLLKNSGAFMYEASKVGINLILHGHKHFPSISKVIYPLHETLEKEIAVIAAGSVGKRGKFPPSYNLIAIDGSGCILVERRILDAKTYKQSTPYQISSYEQVRNKKFSTLARFLNARLIADAVVQREVVKPGSGDSTEHLTYENLTTFSADEVPSIEGCVTSKCGFFSLPLVSSDAKVLCEWVPNDKSNHDEKCYRIVFSPAIGDKPVRLWQEVTAYNAYYFNNSDRACFLDIGGNGTKGHITSLEWKYFSFTNIVTKLCVVSLAFPEGNYPQNAFVEVHDHNNKRDLDEEEYAKHRISRNPRNRSITLALDKPLPGYRYKMLWGIPEDDKGELRLLPKDEGQAQELGQKLLALLSPNALEKTPLQNSMRILGKEVVTLLHAPSKNKAPAHESRRIEEEDIEFSIYVLDDGLSQLRCVALYQLEGGTKDNHLDEIEVGRTAIGQAFRRRETFAWTSFGLNNQTNADFFDFGERHTALMAIPLFWPPRQGRRIGVLAISTHSVTSNLLSVFGDDEESQKTLLSLAVYANVWYSTELRKALNLDPVSSIV